MKKTRAILTSNDPILPHGSVILGPIFPIHQLAEPPSEVASVGILHPVVADIQELQGGAPHHALGYVVREDALCKKNFYFKKL